MIIPSQADVAYGDHALQQMDVWLAESNRPTPFYVFFHGGGFRRRDKRDLPPRITEALLRGGVSVIAANYRFTDDPQYRAPLLDGARALQFIRHRSREWNLDPSRAAAGGPSAGGDIAFWLGFGPDRAQPGSADPVAGQSTALRCLASWQAQTSLDPRFIRSIISGCAWTSEALQHLYRLKPQEYDTPEARELFREFHFVDQVTPQSPPVFLYYVTPNLAMTEDLPMGAGMHHPKFGQVLQERMDHAGATCVLRMLEQLPNRTPEAALDQFQDELAAFVIGHLSRNRD